MEGSGYLKKKRIESDYFSRILYLYNLPKAPNPNNHNFYESENNLPEEKSDLELETEII